MRIKDSVVDVLTEQVVPVRIYWREDNLNDIGVLRYSIKNSTVICECQTKKGELRGICRTDNQVTGKFLHRIGYFANNKLNGEYISYDQHGDIADHRVYKNGKVVRVFK
jgi:antitoxin component YwqK of YwqJK toxin-antitoxin module